MNEGHESIENLQVKSQADLLMAFRTILGSQRRTTAKVEARISALLTSLVSRRIGSGCTKLAGAQKYP